MSKSVTISIVTNSLITGAKLFGFLTTGSPTLFAETVHSATDVINQVFLKVGEVRSRARASERHPFGFGKERYFWALVSAISVLFLGCGASVRHGIGALAHSEPPEPFTLLTLSLLIFAAVLEGYTLSVALKEIGGLSGLKHARTNTTILAVLLEDAVALVGIALTLFVAFWSTLVEPIPQLDAGISIFIGLLMGAVALGLARLNKEILIDVADVGVDREVARLIKERSGIEIEAASTMIDSNRCLLFLRVAQGDLPKDIDFARIDEVGQNLKTHLGAALGRHVDHIYWQFPQEVTHERPGQT